MKKVFYVFRSPRMGIYRDVNKKKSPAHQLYGLSYFSKKKYKIWFSDDGFKVDALFFLVLPLQKLFIRCTSFGFKLDQALKLLTHINGADVVVSTADSAGLPILFLKKVGLVKAKILYISTGLINELDGRTNFISMFTKSLLKKADVIITHSLVEKKSLKKLNDNTFFLPFGVDFEYFKRRREIKDEDFILSIGHDRSRDYSFLAKVAEMMPDQLFLVITYKYNLKGVIFPKNVKCLFNIPYVEVRKLFLKSKLVFLPLLEMNRAEGQISFLEAIASGKIVVAAKVRGLYEVYPKLKKGVFYYKHGNEKDAVAVLKKALIVRLKKSMFLNEYGSREYSKCIQELIDEI